MQGENGKLAGLDGLRAVAVLLVVVFHDELLEFGWVGVQTFFALSGYLITGLLYRARDVPLGSYLKDFYGRRALRIFPLYYVVIAMLGALDEAGAALPEVRQQEGRAPVLADQHRVVAERRGLGSSRP